MHSDPVFSALLSIGANSTICDMKCLLLQVSFLPSLPPLKEKSAHQKDSDQHILNTIFQPRYVLLVYEKVEKKLTMLLSNIVNYCCSRYWTEGNDKWMQQVSSAPSTRADVLQLKESLDAKLQQRGAKRMGICPIRTELYSQCFGRRRWQTISVSVVRTINQGQEYCYCINPSFSVLLFYLDELIRQMAVNCAERGLLLFRIGEEIRTTVSTYKTLYESSIAFGMRKTLLLEKGKADMEKRVKDLNHLIRCVIES